MGMTEAASAVGMPSMKNPGALTATGKYKIIFAVLAVIGFAIFARGLGVDKTRAWTAYLHNHFYFLSLAVGGLFFATVQWVSNAMWSAPIRRLAESFTAYLPFGIFTFAGLIFGLHELYHWTHLDVVQNDAILLGKAGYLNVPFFIIRNFIAIGIWVIFSVVLIGNSLKQDKSGDLKYTLKNRTLGPIFLILFAVSYTMFSFDGLMSLDPHWFSTMYGVYCFAGSFYITLALLGILTVRFKSNGMLNHMISTTHLHDVAKFMFAFTVFYAYIGFSQFMLIWYANLPEETGYYLKRMSGTWLYVSIFLLLGKFLTPFVLLLPRTMKRKGNVVVAVGVFMLVAHWIDVLWLIQPEFFKEGPRVGLTEIGTLMGFAGLFGFVVVRFLSKHNVVAIGDPKLSQSVLHHH